MSYVKLHITHLMKSSALCRVGRKNPFQKFYNCERVDMTTVPNSPFAVEKLGEILDVKVSGEYENITSDDLAGFTTTITMYQFYPLYEY